MKRMNVAEKPEYCPSCGYYPVGTIIYGEPEPNPELQRDVITGRRIIGGCCDGPDMPKWACRNCGCEFMHEFEPISESGGRV